MDQNIDPSSTMKMSTSIVNDTIQMYSSSTSSTTSSMNIGYLDFLRESLNYFYRNFYKFLYQELFSRPSTSSISTTIIKSQQQDQQRYFNKEFYMDLDKLSRQINSIDLLIIISLSIMLTIGRLLMTKFIFIPITKIYGISLVDALKIPESSWKLLFYSCTWLLSGYYIFIQNNGQLFYNPTNIWADYSIDNPVDTLPYAIYMIELSFYLHSLYTTIMVDERRKDTNTLMAHHLICIALIFISYCNRSYKAGLVTLFLHDGCDILLEATKLIRYFKVQHGHTYQIAEVFVNIGFLIFLITWIMNRLYWFPIKVIYMSSIQLESMHNIHVPFITLLVTMLWIILFMNFYWFSFAIRLLYKVATGQINELEDSREYQHDYDRNNQKFKNNFINYEYSIEEKEPEEEEEEEEEIDYDDEVRMFAYKEDIVRKYNESTSIMNNVNNGIENQHSNSSYNLRQRNHRQ